VKEDSRHVSRINEALDALKAMHAGVRGRLIDLITLKDQKYRNAMTVALGRNLEAIVVDTVDTAMACVRYLKEQRVASLTFIPLVGSQGSAVDDSLRTLGGSCRPVVDLLRYDPAIEPAVRYAIGRTLVCDTMPEARKVAYDGEERQKVVTVDGNMLNKNGSVQGGLASIQQRARKWDEKSYDELKRRREELVREGAGVTSEAEYARLKQQGEELASRGQYLESRLGRMKQELAEIEKRSGALGDERKKAEAQIKELEKALSAAKARVDSLDKDIEKRAAEIAKEEAKIFGDFQRRVGIPNIAEIEHHQQQQAKGRAEKRQNLVVAIHKLKTAIDAEEQRAAGVAGGLSAGDVKSAVGQTEKELATCQKDLAMCQGFLDRDTKEAQKVQERVNQLKQELDQLENRIRQRSRNNEAEVRALAAARKHATMLQAACEALRHRRLSLFQRCRMNEIELPTLDPSSAKRARDVDMGEDEADSDDEPQAGSSTRGRRKSTKEGGDAALLRTSEAFTSFSESGGRPAGGATAAGRRGGAAAGDITVVIDFDKLPEKVRNTCRSAPEFAAFKKASEDAIEQLERELDTLAPNLKATSHMGRSEAKLGQSATSLDTSRDRAQKAQREFTKIKELRTNLFMQTFQRIVEHVDRIYRELTMGTRAHDVHGSAYLMLESTEEPYLGGTRYHATPPMKRYMAMEQLSGGERTMAAMALLFAIHATAPTPFFVLDEVDAALDIGNVVKLGQYLRAHTGPECQYIVVSLKEQLYHLADGLIGVFKDTARETSGILTLDISKLPVDASPAK
jgi:structural maintenance of chromosome 1